MGFDLDVSIPVITVFLQGLLSFFSPCVLPLVPLYLSYLSGSAQTVDRTSGTSRSSRGRLIVNTVCFVVGVSFAFFLLGLGFTALGMFFTSRQMLFARIGGVLMILLGLYQLGFLGESKLLSREVRLNLPAKTSIASPILALLLGFTFSFSWTPCVGPALTTVLIMASGAQTASKGFLLIGVYTLGFVLPFLAVGLFAGEMLALLQKHRSVVRYTVKIGGVLMILLGLMVFTGKMNAITGYLSTM